MSSLIFSLQTNPGNLKRILHLWLKSKSFECVAKVIKSMPMPGFFNKYILFNRYEYRQSPHAGK